MFPEPFFVPLSHREAEYRSFHELVQPLQRAILALPEVRSVHFDPARVDPVSNCTDFAIVVNGNSLGLILDVDFLEIVAKQGTSFQRGVIKGIIDLVVEEMKTCG